MARLKGADPLSLVIVSGIVIALVSAAYFWGAPIIQKRAATTDYNTATAFLSRLDSTIKEVANSGGGEKSIDIPIGAVSVVGYDDLGEDANSIIYTLPVSNPLINQDQMSYIDTKFAGEPGTFGVAEPRVILMTSESLGTGTVLHFRMHFRELESESKSYKLLVEEGTSSGGSNSVTVTYMGTENQANGALNGGDLVQTLMKVSVY